MLICLVKLKANLFSHNALPIIVLGTLIVLSEFFYLALLNLNAVNGLHAVVIFWVEMGSLFILYGIGCWFILKVKPNKKQTLYMILLGSILFRLTLLPAGLPFDASFHDKKELIKDDVTGQQVVFERFQLFDSDIWRYLWDGHVVASNINPYEYTPDDPQLHSLLKAENGSKEVVIWYDIQENINYGHVSTAYPPLAQLVFYVAHWIAPGSITIMKLVLVMFERIGILFLIAALKKLRLSSSLVIIYAWNPLMIKVFAGSGHMDAVLVACLAALAYFVLKRQPILIILSFAFAILTKISPLILFPFVMRRVKWHYSVFLFLFIALGYLYFIGSINTIFEGFIVYSREWQFNAGLFALIKWLASFFADNPSGAARIISAILFVLIILVLVKKDDLTEQYFLKAGALSFGALLLLSPTIMPWYLSWVLPFALLARQYYWFVLSAFLLVAFHVMIDQIEYVLAVWLEFGLFFMFIVILMTHKWFYTKRSSNKH